MIGWDRGLTPSAAALLNSTFIQGFELDDYHELGPLHSASVVLPAAFATTSALKRQVTLDAGRLSPKWTTASSW